ncbi:MAG: type IIA DNA topoisomerase subunit B [Parcubacteria group bacterium]|nr:type IIA DNA topoisomerase subunit B [Parcubacteria group bacterium]
MPLKRLKIRTEKDRNPLPSKKEKVKTETKKKKSVPIPQKKEAVTKAESRKKGEYKAADITVLEGLEPVRKRPGMYIGTTGTEGLHHLLWETFDNSRDEAMGGFANRIEIVLLPDHMVRVADNGRGIPVDIHKQTKVSALQTIMTTLHSGGKFGGEGYKISGGLHGVGISVVNALSVYTKAEVHRDGGKYLQEYKRGKQQAKVKKVASSKLNGTIITFEPDPEIFKDRTLNWKKIVDHIRQQAYLVKGMSVTIIDAREHKNSINLNDIFYFKELELEVPEFSFCFEGGISSMVKFYNQALKPIHKNVFYIEKTIDTVAVEVALQYVDDISSREIAFANNTYNQEGGTHMTGFRTALTRTLNDYAKKNNLLKGEDDSLSGDDVREGLTAVVSVKLREIQFEGQTKGKLGSVEARGAVEKVFSDGFSAFLEEKPEEARIIIGKVVLALKARKAAKAAKDSVLRKGALEGFTLPGKLADCQTRDASEAELFIVEGDSAGGSAKTGRDRRVQAILPLRGKILNVERARLDKMLASTEIKALVVALGTAIGDTFNIEKLRYHKIIIATDADVDGAHIRTLLLTLFYRYFKQLIEVGNIYIATPPLYKIKTGKDVRYVYTEAEKTKAIGKDTDSLLIDDSVNEDEEINEEMEKTKTKKVSIQRYKGLGEMNPEELWETTMNPVTRTLKQVTIEDAKEADKVFDILMGTDVPSRKTFIQTHAKEAELDI